MEGAYQEHFYPKISRLISDATRKSFIQSEQSSVARANQQVIEVRAEAEKALLAAAERGNNLDELFPKSEEIKLASASLLKNAKKINEMQ
mmetsp:Transcript_27581/g.20709  ORF Transcript_27581/g.20709 Transcript_27581/m.20709 type:complete len:90 (+) Transcript_27581:280-549(+)